MVLDTGQCMFYWPAGVKKKKKVWRRRKRHKCNRNVVFCRHSRALLPYRAGAGVWIRGWVTLAWQELTSPPSQDLGHWIPCPWAEQMTHMRTNPSWINGHLHALVTLDKSYCNERTATVTLNAILKLSSNAHSAHMCLQLRIRSCQIAARFYRA